MEVDESKDKVDESTTSNKGQFKEEAMKALFYARGLMCNLQEKAGIPFSWIYLTAN